MARVRRIQKHGEFTWESFPYRKNEEGKPLCRWCGKVLDGRRTAWCGKECEREVLLRVHWGYIRSKIKRRDKWKCVLCGARATDVDHIVELADGGSYWKPENLRSLCNRCHKRKTTLSRKIRSLFKLLLEGKKRKALRQIEETHPQLDVDPAIRSFYDHRVAELAPENQQILDELLQQAVFTNSEVTP